jgi:uncharacterized protein YjbJ (UPF0337 family)
MEGMRDKAEGKLKETEGKLTDDELRERQGQAEQQVGEGRRSSKRPRKRRASGSSLCARHGGARLVGRLRVSTVITAADRNPRQLDLS